MPFDLPEFAPGSVWLTGAGPGDPGLLTVLARHGLERADHVLADALVDGRALALARPGAVVEVMGKRGGKPSPKQPEINARLIALAGQGLRVLRLKGGDPFLFGRGHAEAQALAAAGIPFRVVPGVTAGIGGLAYAGISVTSEANSAVAFVTGHDTGGGLPADLDWAALGQSGAALVVYMGVSHMAELAARLMAAGRPGDEPVAVVQSAATPNQAVLDTCLDRLAEAKVAAPALIVVGRPADPALRVSWWGGDHGA
jgi:uroporphyrin-III C-methyltransferase